LILPLIFVAIIPLNSTAGPMPPAEAVNEVTKECSTAMMGDERVACDLIAPWHRGAFPEGFKRIPSAPVDCKSLKTELNCRPATTAYNPNSCSDLIQNGGEKICGFFDDIKRCRKIPRGWKSSRACPHEFKWHQGIIRCD